MTGPLTSPLDAGPLDAGPVDARPLDANAGRFSGFADLYDAVRPDPPRELGEILTAYSGGPVRTVVDLGSGTGLSTRWAQRWATTVIGVEPSDDMRAVAAARAGSGTTTVRGWSHDTGLVTGTADVVIAVQALHWMEPESTLAEAARLLRPGGVFAAVDCDWPPIVGSAEVEEAWDECRRDLRVFEQRVAQGVNGAALVAPPSSADPARAGYSGRDSHHSRRLPDGVRSWSKDAHLDNMVRSGHFAWCREVILHQREEGDAHRLAEMFRSQGDYQALRRHGLDDDTLGVSRLEQVCHHELGDRPLPLWFTYRARLGVSVRRPDPSR